MLHHKANKKKNIVTKKILKHKQLRKVNLTNLLALWSCRVAKIYFYLRCKYWNISYFYFKCFIMPWKKNCEYYFMCFCYFTGAISFKTKRKQQTSNKKKNLEKKTCKTFDIFFHDVWKWFNLFVFNWII